MPNKAKQKVDPEERTALQTRYRIHRGGRKSKAHAAVTLELEEDRLQFNDSNDEANDYFK